MERERQAGDRATVMNEGTSLQLAARDEYGELAPWLVHMSQVPEQHCLHTWSGQSAQALQGQLLAYWDDAELCYVTARRDGVLVGAMGSEYDEGLGRAWLHGPHVATEDWEPLARKLLTRLLAELPPSTGQLDAYLNVENTRGRRFYEQQGFEQRGNLNYDFWLAAGDRPARGGGGCTLLGREHEDAFKQLFQTLFAAAYYSPERIVGMIGQTHQVLVVPEGRDVLGFAVVSTEEGPSIGEVQFLGVREDRRRQGYGRQLLLSAIDWLVDQAGVSGIGLNVGEELAHARSLYERVGFRLRYAGIGLKKVLAR
jgi:ribosomal protein S18 acetylase RimI-like enzyme